MNNPGTNKAQAQPDLLGHCPQGLEFTGMTFESPSEIYYLI